jgi:hypothetical protein
VAVVSVEEIKDGRGGTSSYDRSREINRVFRVITDDDRDGTFIVGSARKLPGLGDVYDTGHKGEKDKSLFASSISPQQDPQDPRLWIVTVRYISAAAAAAAQGGGFGSSQPGGGGQAPQQHQENPLNRPTEWKLTWTKVKKAVYKDLKGNDVTNSAGFYFSPPVERDAKQAIITATKNYPSFDFWEAASLFEMVNTDAWKGFNPRTLKIDGIDIASAYENGYSFVRTTWTILYNPDKWIPFKVLDRGSFYLVGAVGAQKPQPFTDPAGNILAEGLLDGNGGKLAVGANPVYRSFTLYTEGRFRNLLP